MAKRERARAPLAPKEWTEELLELILARIRNGAHPERAAAAEGVDKLQWLIWTNPDNSPMARELNRKVQQAEARAECDLVAGVYCGRQEWRSSGYLLERRWPERWAEEKQSDTDQPLTVIVNVSSDD
jgi:hypothetical protein